MHTRIFVYLAVGTAIYAQSPRPALTPPVLSQSQQEKAAKDKQKLNPDSGVSASSPSTVRQSGAEERTGREDPKRSKIGQPTPSGDPIDIANTFVAGFTGALVVVAVLQWLTFREQARYMGYALRPKIRIRNVEIEGVDSLVRGVPVEVAGTLQIYNSGNSTASVVGIACQLFAFEKLPMRAPFAPPDDSTRIKLPPGVFGTRSFPFAAVDYEQFKGIRQRQIGLYIMGEVAYRDEIGLRRVTRFCRRFDWEKERFLPVTDPDYEGGDE